MIIRWRSAAQSQPHTVYYGPLDYVRVWSGTLGTGTTTVFPGLLPLLGVG